MKIVLTGGTGFIGSAILSQLRASGHDVAALVRSESSADAVRAAGGEPALGDLTDRAWVVGLLSDADGAIHTAAAADGEDAGRDDAVIDAVIEAFGGTDKPYVHTGGIWTYGSGDAITEDSSVNPPTITGWRVERELRVLESDVRAAVVQPGIVYGDDRGIPALVTGVEPDATGALPLVGDGSQHWTTVHVDDLADLYVRALTQRATGHFIGVGGENPTVREVVEATGKPSVPSSREDTETRLGAGFAEALLLDQQATGEHARRTLSWTPSRPTLVQAVRAAAE